MYGQQLSVLEISQIVEQALLPCRCRCTRHDGATLRIQVFAAQQPERDLIDEHVPLAELTSSRAISKLVLELRERIAHADQATAHWNTG